MNIKRTVVMIALTISVLMGGVFTLPSFADTPTVYADAWEYPDVRNNTHNFVLFKPQKVIVPDANGNFGTGTVLQNYINVNKHWQTIHGDSFERVNIPVGSPIYYYSEFVKVEEYKNGKYSGYLEINFWVDGYKESTYSTYIIEENQVNVLPVGFATRLNGAVTYFKADEMNDYINTDGSWKRKYTAHLSYACENGKACVHTIYLYRPDVGWLMFEEPEFTDQDLIDQMKGDYDDIANIIINADFDDFGDIVQYLYDLAQDWKITWIIGLTAISILLFKVRR